MSKSLDQFVREQVSPHISADFQTFVAFLEAYYEWLSKETQPGGKLLSHQSNIDIDQSLEAFAQDFIKTFSESFPTVTRLSPQKVAKQLRNIYTSKGSEQSFKLLFRILFSDEIDIKYPGTDVLVASGGDFRKETSIRVILEPGRINTPFTFEQKTINFYDDTSLTPESPVGFAVVDRVSYFFEGSIPVYELFLTKGSIRGTIKTELKVAENGLSLDDDDTCICYVIPTSSDVSIVKDVNSDAIYSGEVNEGQIFEAKGEDVFFSASSTLNSDNFIITNPSLVSIPLYIGQEIAGPNIQVGSYIKSVVKNNGLVTSFRLTNPAKSTGTFSYTAESRGTYVIVRTIDNDTGAPTNLDILRYGINYYKDYEETLTLVEQGQTKTIRAKFTSGAIADYQGTFKGNGGKLSDIVRLQDKQKYQKFAYVIQTGVSVNNWRAVVKELLNPAGFAFFGELALKNKINLSSNITAANVTDIIRYFRDIVEVLSDRVKHVHKPRESLIDGIITIRKEPGSADSIIKPRFSFAELTSDRVKHVHKPRESVQANIDSDRVKHVHKPRESNAIAESDRVKHVHKPRESFLQSNIDSIRVKLVTKTRVSNLADNYESSKIKYVAKVRESSAQGLSDRVKLVQKPQSSTYSSDDASNRYVLKPNIQSIQSSYFSFARVFPTKGLFSDAIVNSDTRKLIYKEILPQLENQTIYYFVGDYFIDNDDYIAPTVLSVINVTDSISISKNGTTIQ